MIFQGLISYADFKRVFGGNDDEMESRGGGGQSNFEQVQPRIIPELVDLNKARLRKTIFINDIDVVF